MEAFKMYKNLFKLEQKRGRFLAVLRDFAQIFAFWECPLALTYNDVQRGWRHDVFGVQDNLQTQKKCIKNEQNRDRDLFM